MESKKSSDEENTEIVNETKSRNRSIRKVVSFVSQPTRRQSSSFEIIMPQQKSYTQTELPNPLFDKEITSESLDTSKRHGNMSQMTPPVMIACPSIHSEPSRASQMTSSKEYSSVRRTPLPSLALVENNRNYLPAEYEFKGFKRINPHEKCCFCPPRPSMMNTRGWMAWGFLFVICWPLTFLPCVLSCSYDPYQIPVYEPKEKHEPSVSKVSS